MFYRFNSYCYGKKNFDDQNKYYDFTFHLSRNFICYKSYKHIQNGCALL